MKNKNFPFQCILFSWVVGAIGLMLGVCVSPEWFGRFGSLIVLFAVMSEYALLQSELNNLYAALKGQGAAEFGNDTGIPDLSVSKWHRTQTLMSHSTIVVGTLIWGFGDIFIECNYSACFYHFSSQGISAAPSKASLNALKTLCPCFLSVEM